MEHQENDRARALRAASPVTYSERESPRFAEAGLALCLSGGGYRAMVFHLGALWRLDEAGLLGRLDRVSSVSGGSITAALLGLKWSHLDFEGGRARRFAEEVVAPVRALAGRSIDARSIITGLLTPDSIGEQIAEAYDRHLFRGATLQDLPDRPRFVVNATNVQSGVLWRFSKPYTGDYRVGRLKNPRIPLAAAVAASSAFPPFLSPFRLELPPGIAAEDGNDLHRPPFTTNVYLTDGGVYDNLGVETAWKRYETIFVSDAGGGFTAEERPNSDWAQHSYRVLNVVDRQVRALRKRQVVDSYKLGVRKGAYWGIRTNIADYGLADPLECSVDKTTALADIATRLAELSDEEQERLVNWGYAVTDAALRRHYDTDLPRGTFPYPEAGVG
jgi:NTE family protein